MKWMIFTGLGFHAQSAHDTLEEALAEVERSWVRGKTDTLREPFGAYTHTLQMSAQLSSEGELEWLDWSAPKRECYSASHPKAGKVFRETNWEEARKSCDFPSGEVECVCVVREDRARVKSHGDGLAKINDLVMAQTRVPV